MSTKTNEFPTASESKVSSTVSGIDPGQRHLNGPQTTGRADRSLSEPPYESVCEQDTAVPMGDAPACSRCPPSPRRRSVPGVGVGIALPSPIQDLGAPMGFIEAGASDFWVPRGYVHVIANVRGTGGSDGTYSMADEQERQDMHALVEWAAQQPSSHGHVGMIGISDFVTAGQWTPAGAVHQAYALRADGGLAVDEGEGGDDQDPEAPAIMSFRHATVGTSSLNTILSSSRLFLPVLAD